MDLDKLKQPKSDTTNKRRNEGGSDRTVQTSFDSASGGAVQRSGESRDDD